MNKSIAVLGLGRYGMSLAKNLYEMGVDVLAVDKNPERIKEISSHCAAAVCADMGNEDEVMDLGLSNMDVVVTAMGGDLTASIMAITVAKEQGVPVVVAKSSTKRMSSILEKVGADKTIIPEEYGGIRSARILTSDSVFDYFQVGNSLFMVEMRPDEKWVGKSLRELDLRKSHRLNIVAIKDHEGQWALVNPEEKLNEHNRLLVVLERSELNRLSKQHWV